MLNDHGNFMTHSARNPLDLRRDPVRRADFREPGDHSMSIPHLQDMIGPLPKHNLPVAVESDEIARSPREAIQLPLGVMSQKSVKAQKRVSFTRFVFFQRLKSAIQSKAQRSDIAHLFGLVGNRRTVLHIGLPEHAGAGWSPIQPAGAR